jgi:hypothetical protein
MGDPGALVDAAHAVDGHVFDQQVLLDQGLLLGASSDGRLRRGESAWPRPVDDLRLLRWRAWWM